jgi:hypothetical protein
MADIEDIKRIAEIEFSDMVICTYLIDYKLRIVLNNNSFVDVSLSKRLTDKFGFHWETMAGNIIIISLYNNAIQLGY